MSSRVAASPNKSVNLRLKRTEWLRRAGWGVFVHYLAAPASSDGGRETSAAAWNEWVSTFDVEGLANQLQEIGAGYLIFSLGQNSGHYCAPNPVYDEITGIRPSKCSRRDVPAELAAALARRGIALMLYLPSGAPEHDPEAVARLEWREGGARHASFQRKWERVCEYWARHYGSRVKGWWIDGCYGWKEMYAPADEPNAVSFARALRAGNPDAILAFNTGPRTPVEALDPHEDYTAGEINTALPAFDEGRPLTGEIGGAQYHVLTFLGDMWGRGSPRFDGDFVSGYTRYIVQREGVVSWDVPITDTGLLEPAHMEVLRCIGARRIAAVGA